MSTFEKILEQCGKIPGVKVDRRDYLSKAFSDRDLAKFNVSRTTLLEVGPIEAGIPKEKVKKNAVDMIKMETAQVTAVSFVTGLPGGVLMGVAIPADLLQFYCKVFVTVQKLMYLYGWEENIFDDNGEMDEETKKVVVLYIGVACGIGSAIQALTKSVAPTLIKQAGKKIVTTGIKKVLTGKISLSLIKNIIKKIGVRTTLKALSKFSSKGIPIIGGVISGAFTAAAFYPMMMRLRKYFETGVAEEIEDSTFSE